MVKKKIVSIIFLVGLLVSSVQSIWGLEIERPGDVTPIERTLVNHSSDYCASLGLGVQFIQCGDYSGSQAVSMNVSALANTRHGVSYYMQTYGMSDQFSWLTEGGSYSYQDLTFAGYADDAGVWVLLPLPFGPPQGMWLKFYGADYKHVIDGNSGVVNSSIWICTNGFISFDISQSNATHAEGIPSPILPNAVIAPLWTDLEVDEQSLISVRIPYDINHQYDLVIIWKNVLVKSNPGLRLTFTVGLQGYGAYLDNGGSRSQTEIYLVYNNVTAISDRFTYGIEDHEGLKGTGELFTNGAYLTSFNNTVKRFTPQISGDMAYARHMKLTFADNTTGDTEYDFPETGLSGNNLMDLNFSQPDMTKQMEKPYLAAVNSAITYGGTMLTALGYQGIGELLLPWTLPVGAVLLVWNLYDFGCKMQYNKNEIAPGWEAEKNGPTSYVNASTFTTDVVDASLNVYIIWVFKDDYTAKKSHNIRIGATVEYVYEGYTWNLDTGVDVQVTPDASGENFGTATRLQIGPYDTVQFYGVDRMLYIGYVHDQEDYYVLNLKKSYNVSISAMPDPVLDLDLRLYDPQHNVAQDSVTHGSGEAEHIQYFVNSSGDWFFRINRTGGVGFYNMSFNINLVGDINRDGLVDIYDAIHLSNAYGTRIGGSRWNAAADLNNDNTVDIYDAILLANGFGQYYGDTPPPGYRGSSFGNGMRAAMSEAPSVFVDPSQLTVFKDEVFTVNVKITDVTDLQGWEFQLYWNSTVLNCTDFVIQTPTEWQGNAQNYGEGLEAGYNATHARLWIAQAAKYPAPSFNGSMTLATLTFQALQPGASMLRLPSALITL